MDQVINKIMNCRKTVKFQYPEGKRYGELKDRSVIASNPHFTEVPYYNVVDLIEFPDDQERSWMRISYYRVKNGKLNFAGQTSIAEPISAWKKILVETSKEKNWFKNLLEEVMNELKE